MTLSASSSRYYRPYGPRDPAAETRLERFKRMNAFISARGGWITSLPGDVEIRFEALPGSSIPGDLRAIGHRVLYDGEGERIIATRAHARVLRIKCYVTALDDAQSGSN